VCWNAEKRIGGMEIETAFQLKQKSPRITTRGLECFKNTDGMAIDYFTLLFLILAAISW
jgi:hypothetical protein